jgi:hypothetical protein
MSDAGTQPEQPIACTLSPEQVPGRLTDWRELVALATGRVKTEAGVRLAFPSSPDLAGRVADLAAREAACCSFFTFVIGVGADALSLEIGAPPGATELVDSLLEQAGAG